MSLEPDSFLGYNNLKKLTSDPLIICCKKLFSKKKKKIVAKTNFSLNEEKVNSMAYPRIHELTKADISPI